MSKPALVACIQALDKVAGVRRASPKGNKATLKQQLQEQREAERIRRAALVDSRLRDAAAEAAKARATMTDESEEMEDAGDRPDSSLWSAHAASGYSETSTQPERSTGGKSWISRYPERRR